MVDDHVRYALRFQILPGENALTRAKELVEFCRKHKIPEVHLFCNAEEWNRGHLTEAEIEEQAELFAKIIPVLKKAGLSVSLNPWSTLLHCDRGRTLRPGQNFELMVSPSGQKAKAQASPACGNWRKYIAGFYGRMAGLGFEVLWLEDDFRYHNHAPLDWGGDFSPLMLAQFSKKAGRKVSRKEVLKNVLQPGKPHPWRKLWLDLWRETSGKNAGAIRRAVAAANPSARLGLMSSHPDIHGAEGRNWKELFKALAINGRAVHRPHYTSYSEETGPTLVNSFAMLDIQKDLRPGWVTSYPEVDNAYWSAFNKSNTRTFSQMSLAKIMGSEGLLLNLHQMSGNSPFEEPGVGELLDQSYPALQYLGKEFRRSLTSRGAGIPFKTDAAQTIRTDSGNGYQNLISYFHSPAETLGSYGVAFQMRESPFLNLVWGKKAWSFSDTGIKRLLKKGLWLDAEAAEILIRRGYAGEVGIKPIKWVKREESPYAVERVADERSGVRKGYYLSCNRVPEMFLFEVKDKTRIWTEILDCEGKRLGVGLSLHQNSAGGTTAVSAFKLNDSLRGWDKNFQRRAITQNLVRALSKNNPPVMVTKGGPYTFPVELKSQVQRKIAIFNLWTDPAKIEAAIPGGRKILSCTLIRPLSKPKKIQFSTRRTKDGLLVFPSAEIPFYGMVIIEAD